ncbi:MAG: fumarylacetoacetate hydrolase family protein [Prevotellaceae bacterium]|jgi:2-keto-4-pentenoate hydratase/2-oxohepta-3-ene-1,7-dioic acid hydratase in catechol pathway|nr:fumarylacetoacetate hydrolase family protein [Prevotellaceae bacterium]
MKIFVVENNFSDTVQSLAVPVFSMRPETSLLRNNQNFFFPEFTKDIVCGVSVFIRLSRIGRCIYKRFASRYYEEIGAGICFTAVDILHRMKAENKPADIARCFDFSLPISPETISANEINCKNINVQLSLNGEILQSYNTSQLLFDVDEIISYISQFVSFKIGDIVLISLPNTTTKIKIGDKLQAYVNNKKMLDFEVE